jgi:hypothetical protein
MVANPRHNILIFLNLDLTGEEISINPTEIIRARRPGSPPEHWRKSVADYTRRAIEAIHNFLTGPLCLLR